MKRSLPKFQGSSKLIMLLLWVSVFLLVAGFFAGFISSNWNAVPMGLIIGGTVVLGLWILLRWQYSPQPSGSWWRRRSIQAGTNALIAAIAVIVILSLTNVLALRYPTQVDLSEAKLFSLAPQSKEVVRSLKLPLKVLVFSNVVDPQGRTLLEQYQRLNPSRFKFEFIDPEAKPGLTRRYKVQVAGSIVLDMGNRTRTLDTALTEVNLTAAILDIVRNRPTQVFVLQGHGELPIAGNQTSLSKAVEALRRQGFKVDLLNLVERQQIPETTDVLVIAGPKRAFLPTELTLLETYLKQGGRILLMLDPEAKHGLETFLSQWGVQLDQRLVLDASGSSQMLGVSPLAPPVRDYGPHPITKDFGQGWSFYPLAQAISIKQVPDQDVTELLRTGEESWAESEPDGAQLQFDPEQDRQGPLVLGIAIEKAQSPEQPVQAAPEPSPANSQATPSASSPASPKPTPSSSPAASPQPSPTPSAGDAIAPPSPAAKPSPSSTTSSSPQASVPSQPSTSPSAKDTANPSPSSSPKLSESPKPSGNPEPSESPKPSGNPEPSESSKPLGESKSSEPSASQPKTRLVVIGDSDFASSGPFEQPVLNDDLFLNAVTWLSDDDADASLSIRPKEVTNRRLQITPRRQQLLTVLGILLPVSALGVAVTLWWQRR